MENQSNHKNNLESQGLKSSISNPKVSFTEGSLSLNNSRNLGLDIVLLIVGGILTFILSLCGIYNFAMQNEIIKNDPIPEASN